MSTIVEEPADPEEVAVEVVEETQYVAPDDGIHDGDVFELAPRLPQTLPGEETLGFQMSRRPVSAGGVGDGYTWAPAVGRVNTEAKPILEASNQALPESTSLDQRAVSPQINATKDEAQVEAGADRESATSHFPARSGIAKRLHDEANGNHEHGETTPETVAMIHSAPTQGKVKKLKKKKAHQTFEEAQPLAQIKPSGPQPKKQQKPMRAPTLSEVFTVLGTTMHNELNKVAGVAAHERQQHTASLREQERMIATLESDLNAATTTLNEIQKQYDAKEAQIKTLNKKIADGEKFSNGLRNDVQKERSKVNLLLEQAKQNAESREAIQQQVAEATKHAAVEGEKIHEMQLVVQKLDLEKSALDERLQNTEKRLEEQVAERDRLQNQLDGHEALQARLHDLVNDQNLTGISTALEDLLKSKADNQIEISGILHGIEDLRHTRSTGAMDAEEIKKALHNVSSEVTELFKVCTSIQSARHGQASETPASSVLHHVETQLFTFRTELLQQQGLQDEITHLKAEKASAEERLKATESELDNFKSLVRDAEQREQSTARLHHTLLNQLNLRPAFDSSALDNTRRELDILKEQKAAWQNREAVLLQEIEEMKASVTSTRSEIEDYRGKLEAAGSETEEKLRKMHEELTQQADRVQKDQQAEFENKLHQVNHENSRLEKCLKANQQHQSRRPVDAPTTVDESSSVTLQLQEEHRNALVQLKAQNELAIATLEQNHQTELAERSRKAREDLLTELQKARSQLAEQHKRELASIKLQFDETESNRQAMLGDVRQEAGAGRDSLQPELIRLEGELAKNEKQHNIAMETASKEKEALTDRATHAEKQLADAEEKIATLTAQLQSYRPAIKVPAFKAQTASRPPLRPVDRSRMGSTPQPNLGLLDDDDDLPLQNHARDRPAGPEFTRAMVSTPRPKQPNHAPLRSDVHSDSPLSSISESQLQDHASQWPLQSKATQKANSSQRLSSSRGSASIRNPIDRYMGPSPRANASEVLEEHEQLPTSAGIDRIPGTQPLPYNQRPASSEMLFQSTPVVEETQLKDGRYRREDDPSSGPEWLSHPGHQPEHLTTYGRSVNRHRPSSGGSMKPQKDQDSSVVLSQKRRSSQIPGGESSNKRAKPASPSVASATGSVSKRATTPRSNAFTQHSQQFHSSAKIAKGSNQTTSSHRRPKTYSSQSKAKGMDAHASTSVAQNDTRRTSTRIAGRQNINDMERTFTGALN